MSIPQSPASRSRTLLGSAGIFLLGYPAIFGASYVLTMATGSPESFLHSGFTDWLSILTLIISMYLAAWTYHQNAETTAILNQVSLDTESLRKQTRSLVALYAATSARNDGQIDTDDFIDRVLSMELTGNLGVTDPILWVDDHPEGNQHEQDLLRGLGLAIVDARSTDEALAALADDCFSLMISDLKRDDDPGLAGFTLLEQARAHEIRLPPAVLYTGHVTPKWRQDAIDRGYVDSVDDPAALALAVTSTLRSR